MILGIDRFKRVLWRLREMETKEDGKYTYKEVRRAIMEECGTDERTIYNTIEKMKEIKMIKSEGFGKIILI